MSLPKAMKESMSLPKAMKESSKLNERFAESIVKFARVGKESL